MIPILVLGIGNLLNYEAVPAKERATRYEGIWGNLAEGQRKERIIRRCEDAEMEVFVTRS
jgi:hypothetical protein